MSTDNYVTKLLLRVRKQLDVCAQELAEHESVYPNVSASLDQLEHNACAAMYSTEAMLYKIQAVVEKSPVDFVVNGSMPSKSVTLEDKKAE